MALHAGAGAARTMFDKIWDRHIILQKGDDGPALMYIDRDLIHEGSFHAFADLRRRGLPVRRPAQVFGVPDHYVPTRARSASGAASPEIARMIEQFADNMAWSGVNHFPLADARQGIVHVVGPEQGITLPGLIVVCSDSHTSTNGAMGAIAFGVGQSENAHVMATQTLWQRRPRTMRIVVDGVRGKGVSAKDVVLAIIGQIGASGATGYAIEYAGPVIESMSIEERLTVCNMSIEAGARCGMVAPDDKTFDYLHGRPFSPAGPLWDAAVADWRGLRTDADAVFDAQVHVDGSRIAPMVTWGTSPEEVVPIDGVVPDPDGFDNPVRRAAAHSALDYMGLKPGMPMDGVDIDTVFIGSCTNSRLEDLREAAAVIRGRKAVVPAMVVPGSGLVKQAAEREGLHDLFLQAGFQWLEPGCSTCAAMNGDVVAPGKRCASTSNRNFVGRQGPGARTHLVSPAMAAAAAVTGKLTDVRALLAGGHA